MLELGCYAVVVGTMITPRAIVERYVAACGVNTRAETVDSLYFCTFANLVDINPIQAVCIAANLCKTAFQFNTLERPAGV
jgi:hypothetical protein